MIPIQTPVGSIFGLQRWKANNLTGACVKAPLVAIWYTRVSHLFPLLIAQARSTNDWLCAVAQSSGKQLSSLTCYGRWERGDTREQSDLCSHTVTLSKRQSPRRPVHLHFKIDEHLSLITSLASMPLDSTELCDTVYKPLLGFVVYCVLLGPIKII